MRWVYYALNIGAICPNKWQAWRRQVSRQYIDRNSAGCHIVPLEFAGVGLNHFKKTGHRDDIRR